MRKGTKTLGKVLLTSALTAAMAVGMGMTAFATDGEFGTEIANVAFYDKYQPPKMN